MRKLLKVLGAVSLIWVVLSLFYYHVHLPYQWGIFVMVIGLMVQFVLPVVFFILLLVALWKFLVYLIRS